MQAEKKGQKSNCNFCGNSCDCDRYIGKYFDPGEYSKLLNIPEENAKEIVDYLYEKLELKSSSQESVKIFSAGIGPGRIEIPFLGKCLAEKTKIHLTAVDLDTGMIREFYKGLRKRFLNNITEEGKVETDETFKGERGLHFFSLEINDIIQVEAYCGNVQNISRKPYYEPGYYDYVFCIFILHVVSNWEEPLYHLLRMLKQGGKIVFAEEIGDVNWLDNHFDEIEKYGDKSEEEVLVEVFERKLENNEREMREQHRRFWKEYHKVRKERLGKEWSKDTKASDLGVIKVCFKRLPEVGLVKDLKAEKKPFRWPAEERFCFSTLLDWVSGHEQLYTPLNYGLGAPEEIDTTEYNYKALLEQRDWNRLSIGDQCCLGEYMERWIREELGNGKNYEKFIAGCIPRIEGHRFFIYSKAKEFQSLSEKNGTSSDDLTIHRILYGNTVNLYRLRDRIAHEIHSVPGYKNGEVPGNELVHRLFTLKDVYYRLFPFTHLVYTKWNLKSAQDLTKGDLDKEKMPILFTFPGLYQDYRKAGCDKELLLKHLREYLATYLLYFYLTFKDKGDFSFTDFVFRDMPEKFPIIIKKEDREGKPYIQFLQVPSGGVKRLEVFIPPDKLKKLFSKFKFTFDNGKKLSLAECRKKIVEEDSDTKKLLDEFISSSKFHILCEDGRIEYLDFFLCQWSDIEKLTEKIMQKLGSSETSKETNKKAFDNEFFEIFGVYLEKIKDRFLGIEKYNEWPTAGNGKGMGGQKTAEQFLCEFIRNAVRAAIIGYGTEGEWKIFSKYPGKCFRSGRSDSTREEGIGGFIVMRKEHEDAKLEKIFQRHHKAMMFLVSGLWARNDAIFEWGRLTKLEMLKHGTKAAVAAIMARNMSHIHGSHIEAGLQNKMDTFEEVITQRIFEDDR